MVSSLEGKSILITGGTGSFGSTMAAHALKKGASEIRIFSRDEAKQDQMRHKLRDARMQFLLGDTRDYDSVHRAMKGVNLVFHAAALKQVPSAEFFPMEAVKTNILGSSNVLRSAIDSAVDSVVCLSTDKAVYPINAMGMTKALMEKVAQAHARHFYESGTIISVTRYGNVMYSRGSVIPLFISQIKQGRPVTVTDPNMTRFLMSLPDSVDLVEHAFNNAKTGDIFVRKSPAASIEQLSRVLISMFPESSSTIAPIGFRHGEKLYESLLSSEEKATAEDLGMYYRVPLDSRDLNYADFFEKGDDRPLDFEPYTSHNAERLTDLGLRRLLESLPEVKAELG